MEKITEKDIDWLLNLNSSQKRNSEKKSGVSELKKYLLKLTLRIAGISIAIVLPFFMLVRISVFLNVVYEWQGWLALAVGMASTITILLIYSLVLFPKIQNKKRYLKNSITGFSIVVFGYCMFSLFYLSGINAKTPEVRDLYRSMHPILRVAVSTVTLADHGLVVTDIGRDISQYSEMGLPDNPNSLHFRQTSGYVHAVDLRTSDRGIIRNFVLQQSLNVMGFRTLRHTGTADHLHVELVPASLAQSAALR